MPWIGNGSFQPIEGLAGKKYADGTADANSNTFLPLTGTASQDQRNEGGAVTLPLLTVRFRLLSGAFAQADLDLPRLEATGYTGGHLAARLPSLSASGTGTVTAVGAVSLTLPALEISASGTVPWPASASLRLPRLSADARFGWGTALALPALSVAASGIREGTGAARVVLPALAATGTISVTSLPSYGAVVLPALAAGIVGRGDLTLPLLAVHGYDAGAISSTGVGVGAFDGWAMNLRTNAVSHVTGWPFRQILRWGDKTIGVGQDGLYEIGGEKDDGQAIAWEWRTGLDDLKKPGIKRVPVVYLDAVVTGDIFVTTQDDKGDVRSYRYESKRGRTNMPHRQQLGLGVRTRNIAIGAKSGPHGAFMELDGIEPEATVTQRSV